MSSERAVRLGEIAGLPTPHPLGEWLPGLYQADESDSGAESLRPNLALRFTAALDEVIAPVMCALDNMGSYLDPRLTPEDFLVWLASWVGLELDEGWPIERRRRLVGRVAELYRNRGTSSGLAEYLELFTSGAVEIIESGGTSWSTTPEGALPGSANPRVSVRVKVTNPDEIEVAQLERLVSEAKPAHIVAEVVVLAA